jgi:hypothetical protein
MKISLGICAVCLFLAGTAGNVHAAAWCAVYDVSTRNCGFHTYQQCLQTISGVGGYCVRNTYEDSGRSRRQRQY